MKNNEFRNMIIISASLILLATVLCAVFLGWIPAAAVFVTGFVLLVVFFFYTKKRYKKIEQLNDYLVRVLADLAKNGTPVSFNSVTVANYSGIEPVATIVTLADVQ